SIRKKVVGGEQQTYIAFMPLGCDEKFLRCLGWGRGSFKNVMAFAAEQGILHSLAANYRRLLLPHILSYNNERTGIRSRLQVNVQAVWEGIIGQRLSPEESVIAALQNNDIPTTFFILNSGKIDMNFVDKAGKGFLHYATKHGNIELVNFFLK